MMNSGILLAVAVVSFAVGLMIGSSNPKRAKDAVNCSSTSSVNPVDVDLLRAERSRLVGWTDDLRTEISLDQQKLNECTTSVQQYQAQLEEAKSAKPGRYVMKNDGFRTWRFDTATGRTCLLMTTDADWKEPEVQGQRCSDGAISTQSKVPTFAEWQKQQQARRTK